MSETENNNSAEQSQPVAQPVTTDAEQAKDSVEAEPVQSESDANKDSSPAAPMQDNTVGTTTETREATDTRDNQDREG